MAKMKGALMGAVTAGVGIIASLAMTGTALAAPGANNVGPDQPGHPATGSLTIHKFVGDAGAAGNGLAQTITGHDPLPGVTFEYQRVAHDGTAIDLTTPEGWALIGDGGAVAWDSATHILKSGYTLTGAPVSAVTNAQGEIEWTGVPLGAYVVTETSVGDNPVVEKSLPFLVTIPLPHSDGGWIYDVHAYPKNQVMEAPTKTVGNPANLVMGATVPWTITSEVPTLNAGTFDSLVISDPLDSRLEYESAVIKAGATTFDETTDYVKSGNAIFTFTPAGLTKLGAEQGETLTVALNTKVVSLTAEGLQSGQVPNKATVAYNGTPLETGEPQVNYGGLIVNKTDSKTNETLAGAEFAVYELGSAASCEVAAEGTAVVTGKTGNDGVYSVAGLWVGNDSVLSKDYCLVETKAPAGYKISVGTQKVTISAEGTAVVTANVENTPKTPGEMPPTGAIGTVALAAGGSALLALGLVMALRSRKETEAVN